MRIYILFKNEKIIDDLKKVCKSEKVDVIGSGPYNGSVLKKISLGTPDIVLVDNYDDKELKELCSISKNIIIIMLSNDLNRSNNTQNNFNKDGIKNFFFIDISKYSPIETLKIIVENYADLLEQSRTDDIYSVSIEEQDDSGQASVVDVDNIDELELDGDPIKISSNKDSLDTSETSTESDDKTDSQSPDDNDLKDNEVSLIGEDEANKIPENKRFRNVGRNSAERNLINNLSNNVEFDNNALVMRTRIIHIHSKKGGVGKTTLVKELGNMFSAIRLPKKVNRQNEFLKTCVLDLDFERGNLKTMLGIEQCSPNVYDWIEDIVTNVENNIPIEKIKYNNLQVLSRFTKKINDNLFAVITSKGEMSNILFQRISRLEIEHENILKSIIDLIINSLRGVFDIVLIDSGTEFNDISLSAYENSDTNLIVVVPSISSFESTKEELEEINRINGNTISTNSQKINTNTIAVIINQDRTKTAIDEDIDEMLTYLKVSKIVYEDDIPKIASEPVAVAGRVAFDPTLIQFENICEFSTNSATIFKKTLSVVAQYVLPIFKINVTRAASVAHIKKELAKREEEKKPNRKKNKKKKSKNIRVNKIEETLGNLESETNKKKTFEDLKDEEGQLKGKVLLGNDEETSGKTLDDVMGAIDRGVNNKAMTLKEFYSYNFPKNTTVESFINILKEVVDSKHTVTGFPIIQVRPKSLSNRIFKKYVKISMDEIKRSKKHKK